MKRFSLSLRGVLLLTIGALTLTIVSFTGVQLLGDATRLKAIARLSEETALSDEISEAAEATALARDVTLSMLTASDPDYVRELRPRLVEVRAASDRLWAQLFERLKRFDKEALPALGGRLVAGEKAIRDARPAVDRTIDLPPGKRDPDFVRRWADEVATVLADADGLWQWSAARHASIDPIATLHMRYKSSLRAIRNYAGQERSEIAQLVSANAAPNVREVATFLRRKGAMDELWALNRSAAEQSGLYDEVASAYSDAVSHYLTVQGMLDATFYDPSKSVALPIGPDLWFEIATQAADSLDTLNQVSKDAAQTYLRQLVEKTRERTALHIVFSSLALIFCGACFWLVVVRVIRPINGIVDALVRTMRGERAEFLMSSTRQDEIGALNSVLLAFRRTWDDAQRTARELARSESYQRAVLDHATDGLLTVDETGTVRSFNRACEQIFGYDAGDVIGQHIRVLVPNESEYERIFFGGDAPANDPLAGRREYTALRSNGCTFPIELSASTFINDGAAHFSAIIRDVTERKHAEQERLNYMLALERSNKELDDFAYIASHDLKEPLRGIHNHSRFLLEDNDGKLEAESVTRLNRLVYLSQRMERLVNDLLYFSRLGRQEMAVQLTDMNAVVHDVESTLDHFLAEHAARVTLACDLPTVKCDKPRITEVFRNLITNAVKYNDSAEKRIEIGFLPSKVADQRLRHSVFFVRDNGCGIDPEFHQEVFRIFKRLQASKQPTDGTGVGLTFVQKIIERHGGKIWLESARGQGTTFFFTLEAEADEGLPAAEAA